MVRIIIPFLLLFFSTLLPVHAETGTDHANASKIQALVANIIRAYGGRETIEGIKSVYAEGTIRAIMLKDSGTYVRYLKRDRKLNVSTKYERSSELRILNGDRGYRGTRTTPLTEVSGYRYLAMVYQYKYLDLPYGLLQGWYQIGYEGKEDLNGSQVEVLTLNDKEGPPMKVYIDAENFSIKKVSGYFSIEGRKADLSAEFSDFRKLGNTLFPFIMINYGSDQKISETVFKDYKINREIDDSLFDPPPALSK